MNPRFKNKHKKDNPENYEENGKTLQTELDETEKFAKREKPVVGENVFLALTTKKPIHLEYKLLEKYFTFSLQTSVNSAIVSINEPQLQELRMDIKKYTKSEEQKTYIAPIKKIARVEYNKISRDLQDKLDRKEHVDIDVEVNLLPNMGKAYYTSVLERINGFLDSSNSPVIDQFFDDHVASIRATVKEEIIFSMVQGIDSIWEARKAPEALFETPQGLELKELPQLERYSDNLEPICVLDTGVYAVHPLLKAVVSESYDLTPDKDSLDFCGHGTFVAGLAAYGDLENVERRRSITPTASIVSAKIQSKEKKFNKQFLEKRITKAVELLHDRVKLFSLSVMYPNYCDLSKPPSNLAHTLDTLASKYDVLFVLPCGNLQNSELNTLINKEIYPKYFDESCCVQYHGAEACNCITVGGLAHKKNNRSIATKEGQPSPFTRRGQLTQRFKPDIVHNAGNLEIDYQTGAIGSNKEELGVISLGIGKQPVAYAIGTSYSAPMVTNILAKLKQVYPNASLNLLKALLIHSSSWPESHSLLDTSREMKKILYGKGLPDFEKAAYCQNYSPTYILEDSIKCDETASILFFVPEIMKKIWNRRIRITLVYDPPVNIGVDGYTLVDLDFKLFKQLKDNRIVEQTQKSRWTHDFRLPWDNVKADVFTWQQSGWGKEWLLEIAPDIRFRGEFDGPSHVQNYALVITIEDPDKTHNIYEEIEKEQRRLPQVIKSPILKPTKQLTLVPIASTLDR